MKRDEKSHAMEVSLWSLDTGEAKSISSGWPKEAREDFSINSHIHNGC